MIKISKIFDFRVPISIRQYLPHTFVALIFSLFFLVSPSKHGADLNHYVSWSKAFQHGDIFILSGDILSPLKVPLSQWSFGPGLLFSIGSFFFKNPTHGAWVVGWFFIIIFWWAFIGILHHVSKGNTTLTILGICIAFIGTHLGYFSSSYSSESLSFTSFAILFYWVLTQQNWTAIDFLFVGILAGLLIIIRPQLIIYCIPIYGILLYRIIEETKKQSFVKTCNALFLSIFPTILSITSILLSNRWMTGYTFKTPYVFGSNSFKSMDWKNPELLAVLIHPWHGLLSYHPLYAIGFISLIFLIFYQEKIIEKIFILILTLVLLLHFYLQASWYVWWLGGSFGMRGLSISAIILIPALIYFLTKNKNHFLNSILYSIIFLSCFWSFLLLLQHATNFYTYKQLFHAQYKELIALFSFKFIFFLILILTIGIAKWLNERKFQLQQFIIILTLGFMSLYYLLSDLPNQNYLKSLRIFEFPFSYPFFIIIQTMLIALIPFVMYEILLLPHDRPYLNISLKRVMPYTYFVLFCIITFLFTRLAINTEKNITNGIIPINRPFNYISSVDIREVGESYEEYLRVPGFEEKKIALYNYFTSLKEKARISQNIGN